MTMVDPIDSQKQWLVRKNGSGISLLGPYYTDQVRMMVEQGMLDVDDELCPENSYWFSLREAAEVKRFLGIDKVPSNKASDEEATQPDLVDASDTDPNLEAPHPNSDGSTGMITIKRPPPAAQKSPPVSAAELASRFKRVNTSQFLGYGGGSQKSPQMLGIEKSRFWSMLFIACVVAAALGVVWVLKSLKV